MTEIKCRSCQARIFFHVSPTTGKKIPMDYMPRIMVLTREGKDWGNLWETMESVKGHLQPPDFEPEPKETGWAWVYISHFKTCPDAQTYSGRNRQVKDEFPEKRPPTPEPKPPTEADIPF